MTGSEVTFTYVNWRGERGERHVVPMRIFFGESEWHPEPQWILVAFDLAKDAVRYFTMKDITNWRPVDVSLP